jgi:hypothetical protein
MSLPPVFYGVAQNRDIYPSHDYVQLFPALVNVLDDHRVNEAFDQYDKFARQSKRRYLRVGLTSTILGMAALEFEAVSLGIEALGNNVPRWSTLVFPGMAVASIVLAIGSHFLDLRRKWLVNVYLRERLRQWRHQILLDGGLMDLVVSDVEAHVAKVNDRWLKFVQDAAVADGKYTAFIGTEGAERPLFGPTSTAVEDTVRMQVLTCQRQLRLDYQLEYVERKLATGDPRPGVTDVTYITDLISTTSLALAVSTGVAIFVYQLFNLHGSHHAALGGLAALALVFVVASAGTRAIRSGLTVPDEKLSYEEYATRIRAFAELYRSASTDDERWHVLVRLEVAAAEELRRFLQVKEGSRFVF